MYTISTETIPQDKRKEINDKIGLGIDPFEIHLMKVASNE